MIAFLSFGTVHLTDLITLESDVARLYCTCVQISVSQRPDKGPMGIKSQPSFLINLCLVQLKVLQCTTNVLAFIAVFVHSRENQP